MNYRPILYIAGPMRGYNDYNRSAFNNIEGIAREIGWRVINPAILPPDLPRSCYMPICIAMLEAADAIYLLPGSNESMGAKAEKAYAEAQNLTVLNSIFDLLHEYAQYTDETAPEQLTFEEEFIQQDFDNLFKSIREKYQLGYRKTNTLHINER